MANDLKSQSTIDSCRGDLVELGLTDDLIREVVVEGEVERDAVTSHDPPSRGGFNAFAQRIRALRDRLVPMGWTYSNTKNLCTVISPNGDEAIVVVTGDRHTGSEVKSPQPKYARGDATAYAVARGQTAFPFLKEEEPDHAPRLWLLLVHRVHGKDEVRIELSIPDAITDEGFVSKWQLRHIVPPIDLCEMQQDATSETDHEEIEVPVHPKA